MDATALAVELIAMARRQAADGADRDRVAAALSAALMSLMQPACSPLNADLSAALSEMSACLIRAGDHAEYVAELVARLMAPPLGCGR